MGTEVENEDRLTKSEFAELIQHLSVQEILTIEYRLGLSWNKLFSRKNENQEVFLCNLCILETISFKKLLAHIDSRKHKLHMDKVKQLYHPDYTYPKNYKMDRPEKCLQKNNEADTQNELLALDDSDEEESPSIENNKSNFSHKTELYPTEEDGVATKNKKEECAASEDVEHVEDGQNQIAKSKADQKTKSLVSTSAETLSVSTRITDTKAELNNVREYPALKKRKMFINPEAIFSLKMASMNVEKKTEENTNKPNYQTDKIIIPTIHKNKLNNDKDLQPRHSNDIPKFSTKAYSCNSSDNDVHGILGVEYVIKILKNRNDVSPRYECGLCEIVLDGFTMQRHLEGYNHRLKFCEKHFPTAIRQYRQYMHIVPESEIFKVMAPILGKLAVAIEQHHGRNLPYECYESDFNLNRHEILAKAFSCRHASEQYGPAFTHVVGSEEVDVFINNRHKYLPASFSSTPIFDNKSCGSNIKNINRHKNYRMADKESYIRDRHSSSYRGNPKSDDTLNQIMGESYMSSDLVEDMNPSVTNCQQKADGCVRQHVDDETYNLMVDDFLKETLKGLPKNSTIRDNQRRSLISGGNLGYERRKSLSPLRKNDIWQAYRHMVDQGLHEIDESYIQYRRDPETHPSYNEEWQRFWKRRKDELVSAGVDHRNYNYQPEWVRFVKVRMEELYAQEVENVKIKSRHRLCLPLSNEYIVDEKYHVSAPKIGSENEIATNPYDADINISLSANSTSFKSSNNKDAQVVSVLRLMTALEDNLGSLGPKIIDLLSKALQTEKTNPLHVNAIILTDENCSIIETAKEKCKALLITGLFEGSKKKVLNQVVQDTEALLQHASHFKQQWELRRSFVDSTNNRIQKNTTLSLDLSSVEGSNTLQNRNSGSNLLIKKGTETSLPTTTQNVLTRTDKKELASKLAATLVAQGKTDYDPQQLEQLIAVYKLIEKQKRQNVRTTVSNNESASSSSKPIFDTLSDILKSTSSARSVSKDSNASHSVSGFSNQTYGTPEFSAFVPNAFRNRAPSNSLTSVLQYSSDNYFNNTAQSMAHTLRNNIAGGGGGGNQLPHQSYYGINYSNNLQPPNQQNSNMGNFYKNPYQSNNSMTPNWGPTNNNFPRTSGWNNF